MLAVKVFFLVICYILIYWMLYRVCILHIVLTWYISLAQPDEGQNHREFNRGQLSFDIRNHHIEFTCVLLHFTWWWWWWWWYVDYKLGHNSHNSSHSCFQNATHPKLLCLWKCQCCWHTVLLDTGTRPDYAIKPLTHLSVSFRLVITRSTKPSNWITEYKVTVGPTNSLSLRPKLAL